MEEMKNVPSKNVQQEQSDRRPYVAPSAEIIRLIPTEPLAVIDNNHIPESERWALSQWKWSDNCLASGGITGTVNGSLLEWATPED